LRKYQPQLQVRKFYANVPNMSRGFTR